MHKQDPKAESDESHRMWASASFVGVLIIIGLPLWWKTTEVYRVALPYERINSLEKLPLSVATRLTIHGEDEETALSIGTLIKKAFEDIDIIKLEIKTIVLTKEMRNSLDLAADDEEAVKKIGGVVNLDELNSFHLVQRKSLPQDSWLGMERVMFFRDTKSASTIIESLKNWVYEPAVLSGAVAESADEARRLRTSPAGSYHLLLTVAHAASHSLTVDFDAAEAMDDYIGSFVDELSELHNFTLKSQWLHMLDFNFEPVELKDTNGERIFGVRQERLQRLLTRLEERAAPPLGVSGRTSATSHSAVSHHSKRPAPALHLVLYVTPCRVSPLRILDQQGNPVQAPVQAFVSPHWGGVVLCSPPPEECGSDSRWAPDTKLVMGTFLAQLRELIGITKTNPIPGAKLADLRSPSPRKWEVDRLLRLRTLEQLSSARRTLASLAQLLGEISNIVINDDVGASITSAVEGVEVGAELCRKGVLQLAHQRASRATNSAEDAFMDPTLLALLYFPDDQKYAIYIPLFLPIMFPVVLSLKNLLLWFRGKPIHKDKSE